MRKITMITNITIPYTTRSLEEIALSARISQPTEDAHLIVLAHGLDSNKRADTIMLLQETFNSNGLGTCAFDFYGCGESQGSYRHLTPTIGKGNIEAVWNHLKENGYHPHGLFGSSFGGFTSLLAGPSLQGLKAMALRAPPTFDTHEDILRYIRQGRPRASEAEWKENQKRYPFDYTFCEDCMQLGRPDYQEMYENKNIPILVSHGTADEVVPYENTFNLTMLLKGKMILSPVEGATHIYTTEQSEKMTKNMAGFFGYNLLPDWVH